MSEPAACDPQLVQRIRELVADPTAQRRGAEVTPGWVPAEPPRSTAGPKPPPEATTGVPATPRVLTLPGFLRGARMQVDRRALLALVVVAVAAALVFSARVAAATAQGEPVPVEPNPAGRMSRSTPAGFGPTATVRGASSSPSAPGAGGGLVHVHVVGQVATPQVVTLGTGSRVADAVAGAGGALPSADLSRVNLARLLADGEQIHVPAPGEPPAAAPSAVTATAGALVDLNTADLAALDALPGVGPVLAQRIVDWRTAHGRFSTVEELGEVSGIGDKLLAQVRPKVTVGNASRR